jgi:hypothetical protein
MYLERIPVKAPLKAGGCKKKRKRETIIFQT